MTTEASTTSAPGVRRPLGGVAVLAGALALWLALYLNLEAAARWASAAAERTT